MKTHYFKWLPATFIFFTLLYLFMLMPRLRHPKALKQLTGYHYAHRGLFNNKGAAPENSLVAFQKAMDAGYGIELDVQLTKDAIPVVVHDHNLQRLTGENVLVSSLTYAQLCQYVLLDSHETIPTLEEAFQLIDGQVPVMVELKTGLAYSKICECVSQLLKGYHGDYCVTSFSPLALKWFRQNMPEVVRGQLSTNYNKDHIKNVPMIQFMLTHLLFNFFSRPDFIAYNYQYLPNPSVTLCQKLFACPIAGWTVRSPAAYDLAKEHCDIIIFDNFQSSI